MNIYVVSSCWWRDGATVIGAGVDRADAEAIADRTEVDDHRWAAWAPWKEDVSPAEGSCTWRRDALMADGTTHQSLYQEIVCVPLAGIAEVGSLPPGLRDQVRERFMLMPSLYGEEIAEIGRSYGAP